MTNYKRSPFVFTLIGFLLVTCLTACNHDDDSTSSSSTCPTGYVLVPGNSLYDTPSAGADFCVMKYAASNQSGVAESNSTDMPWTQVNKTEAGAGCGSDAHLVTNAEWMVVARDIEATTANWNTSSATTTGVGPGPVGTGVLSKGNVGSAGLFAAPSTDDDPYNGSIGTTWVYKRTHQLSNGNIIWDMGGNVMQWVGGTDDIDADIVPSWDVYTNATVFPAPSTSGNRLLFAPDGNHDTSKNVGDYWGGGTAGGGCTVGSCALVRGGSVQYHALNNDGIFMVDTYFSSTDSTRTYIGFRCATAPL